MHCVLQDGYHPTTRMQKNMLGNLLSAVYIAQRDNWYKWDSSTDRDDGGMPKERQFFVLPPRPPKPSDSGTPSRSAAPSRNAAGGGGGSGNKGGSSNDSSKGGKAPLGGNGGTYKPPATTGGATSVGSSSGGVRPPPGGSGGNSGKSGAGGKAPAAATDADADEAEDSGGDDSGAAIEPPAALSPEKIKQKAAVQAQVERLVPQVSSEEEKSGEDGAKDGKGKKPAVGSEEEGEEGDEDRLFSSGLEDSFAARMVQQYIGPRLGLSAQAVEVALQQSNYILAASLILPLLIVFTWARRRRRTGASSAVAAASSSNSAGGSHDGGSDGSQKKRSAGGPTSPLLLAFLSPFRGRGRAAAPPVLPQPL